MKAKKEKEKNQESAAKNPRQINGNTANAQPECGKN